MSALLVADGSSDAPQLRIEAPPPIRSRDDQYGKLTVILVLLGIGLGTLCFGAAASYGVDLSVSLGFVGTILCFVFAGLALRARRKEKEEQREHQWFRDHGLPRRATIERIRAGHGRVATLGLKIEAPAGSPRKIHHKTSIPQLLVPRVAEGLALPIIVHPNDPDRIEVQWHLV